MVKPERTERTSIVKGKSAKDNGFSNPKFEGEKGRLLLELQKSYKGDTRFQLSDRFKNDIDVDKLSKNFKNITDKEILEGAKGNKKQAEPEEEEVNEEKEKQLKLLEQLGISKPITKQKKPAAKEEKKKLIITHFDPTSMQGQKIIKEIENKKKQKQMEQNRKKNEEKKEKIRIQKGIDKAKFKIEKANKLLEQEQEQPKPKHEYQIKVNGSKEEAFKQTSFKLF